MTTAEEIKADIQATRAELAETADALATRLDAKAQAGKRIAMIVTGAAVGTAMVAALIRRVRK
jgi:predicted phosphoribosyltransferase